MVEYILLRTLERHGLTLIATEGEVNPPFHEVVKEVEGDKDVGTIANVIKRGYTLNGKVLRPAKVSPFTVRRLISGCRFQSERQTDRDTRVKSRRIKRIIEHKCIAPLSASSNIPITTLNLITHTHVDLQPRLLSHQRIPSFLNLNISIIPKQKLLHNRISPLIRMSLQWRMLTQHNPIPFLLFRTIWHVKYMTLFGAPKDNGRGSWSS
jgi:hypothetical protein